MNRQRSHSLMSILAVLVVSGVVLAAAAATILLYRALSQPRNEVAVSGISPNLSQEGVVVTFLQPDGAAAQAGIQRGDIILSVAGHPVQQRDALREQITLQGPGQPVLLGVLHGDELRNVTVMLADQPPLLGLDGVGVGEVPPGNLPPFTPTPPLAGTPAGQPFSPPARIIAVVPGSPAEAALLQPDDLITALDGQQVRSVQDVIGFVLAKQPGDVVQFTVQRQGVTVEALITLAPHPDGSGKPYLGINLPPFSQ